MSKPSSTLTTVSLLRLLQPWILLSLLLLVSSRLALLELVVRPCHGFVWELRPWVPRTATTHPTVCSTPPSSSRRTCTRLVWTTLRSTRDETRTSVNTSTSTSTSAKTTTTTSTTPPTAPVPSNNNNNNNNNKQQQQQQQEGLSELDARVLYSMLQDDSTLDLQQEENMRRLLERGVASSSSSSSSSSSKTSSSQSSPNDTAPQEEARQFSSQSLQKLTNTKLWKALRRRGTNVLESAGIYLLNRIERDTKLALSVGLFAWDRAVRDAGRALPSSGRSGAAVGRAMRTAVRQLGDSSSFEEMQQSLTQQQQKAKRLVDVENLYDEFNTPMDEIRSVTQSIRDILSGEATSKTSSASRGLRSVAPAGLGNNAERQKRAFNRRKKTKLRQEKEFLNVGRTAGGVVDAAFEMKRELQVESSKPGYRSEGARKAIAAGAAQTARVLEAAKRDGWIKALSGTAQDQEETIREMIGSADVETSRAVAAEEAIAELLEEEYRVIDRIQLCIENPAETWLTLESMLESTSEVNDGSLQEVVTALICARDDLEVDGERTAVNEDLTLPEMVDRMRQVKRTVDMIVSLAASGVSLTSGENLRNILYSLQEGDESQAVLLSLDAVESSVAAAVEAVEDAKHFVEVPQEKTKRSLLEILFTDKPTEEREPVMDTWDQAVVPEVESSWTDVSWSRSRDNSFNNDYKTKGGLEEDASVRLAKAELVSDDDFDRAVNSAKATTTLSDDEIESAEADEDNLLGSVLLRSLDVVLFVAEKVLSGVPVVVRTAATVSTRLVQVSRGGLGYIGWKKVKNAASGAKRY